MKISVSIIFFINICLVGETLSAQTASEALRYTITRPYATARSAGCGDGITALGAEFTASSINPAGIGLFRKSDAYISLKTQYDEVSSQLENVGALNNSFEENTSKLSLNGVGVVGVTAPANALDWKNVNWLINISRIADFRRDFYFEGRSKGSITDRFLELSLDPLQGGLVGLHPDDLDDFEAGLAYETGAVYDNGLDSLNYLYITDFLAHPGYAPKKEQTVKQYGGLHEFSFGLGGNFQEWMALGLSLHVPFGYFENKSVYRESEEIRDEYLPFRRLSFESNLKTRVSGVGAKLGVILKPVKFLRLGAVIQSPYLYELKDEYDTELQYTFFNGRRDTSFMARSPKGEFEYQMITPIRGTFSAALISPLGFISADVDWINPHYTQYNLTEHSEDPGDAAFEQELNQEIKKQYQSVLQYRIGGELALSKFRLRAGYQYLAQPYADSDDFNTALSFGLGYRGDRHYFDLSFTQSKSREGYAPYYTGNSDFNGDGQVDAITPLVLQEFNRSEIMITMGVKF